MSVVSARRHIAVACLALAAVATACSPVVRAGAHDLAVSVRAGDELLEDVSCKISNDEGSWSLIAPDSAEVTRSRKSLSIECEKDGYEPGYLTIMTAVDESDPGTRIIGAASTVTDRLGIVGDLMERAMDEGIPEVRTLIYPDSVEVIMGRDIYIEAEAPAEKESGFDLGF